MKRDLLFSQEVPGEMHVVRGGDGFCFPKNKHIGQTIHSTNYSELKGKKVCEGKIENRSQAI